MSKQASPLVELTRARVLETLREPGIVFWVFGFPVLMAVLLGIAFRNRPPQALPVAVSGPGAAWVLEALGDAEGIAPERLDPESAAEALRTGRVELLVDAETPGRERVVYRFDPSRPQSAAARLEVDDALQRAAGRDDPVDAREETETAVGSRYIDFLMPGLVGLNLMGSSMWGVGFAVMMARVRKLLKRFAATPMRRGDYLLSLMLSRLVFLVLELIFLVAFGWIAFGVVIRGSPLSYAVVALLGAFAFAGIGLLTAARTKTVEVASGLMNVVMLPMWLLSGAFFSYTRFPELLHPVIAALPLTALIDALRAITNDGATLVDTAPQVAILVGWNVVGFAAALKIFRWQ